MLLYLGQPHTGAGKAPRATDFALKLTDFPHTAPDEVRRGTIKRKGVFSQRATPAQIMTQDKSLCVGAFCACAESRDFLHLSATTPAGFVYVCVHC